MPAYRAHTWIEPFKMWGALGTIVGALDLGPLQANLCASGGRSTYPRNDDISNRALCLYLTRRFLNSHQMIVQGEWGAVPAVRVAAESMRLRAGSQSRNFQVAIDRHSVDIRACAERNHTFAVIVIVPVMSLRPIRPMCLHVLVPVRVPYRVRCLYQLARGLGHA